MQKQEIKQEKMSADVLIIGGGIAGLTAAISVKEENPVIPEKQIKAVAYYSILIWKKQHRRCSTNIMQTQSVAIWQTRTC